MPFIWKYLLFFVIGFICCHIFFNRCIRSLKFYCNDKEVVSLRMHHDKLLLNSSTNSRFFDHLTIDCKPSTSWRFINESISRLLASGFRFKSIRFKIAEDRFALYFPVDELMNIKYDSWADKRIKSLDCVRNPILPSYNTETDIITVGRIDENGEIFHGFTEQKIVKNKEINDRKNKSLILFVDWNCELSQVIIADKKLYNMGYKNIIFVAGSSPLQWPPFFIPRSLKELKIR